MLSLSKISPQSGGLSRADGFEGDLFFKRKRGEVLCFFLGSCSRRRQLGEKCEVMSGQRKQRALNLYQSHLSTAWHPVPRA